MGSQRSYIENVTAHAVHSIPSSSQTLPSDSRLWNASHAGSSTQQVHPVEIDVHEMRAVHDSKILQKTVTDDGDEASVLERTRQPTKLVSGEKEVV